MKINILRNEGGSLFACNENGISLFQFEFRSKPEHGGPAWYFWLRGNYNPHIFKGEIGDFPMHFFKSACRAVSFLWLDKDIDDEVAIASGQDNLGKKMQNL